eukprot:scaffold20055_cov118-Isochrysis_galbana.AAC.2
MEPIRINASFPAQVIRRPNEDGQVLGIRVGVIAREPLVGDEQKRVLGGEGDSGFDGVAHTEGAGVSGLKQKGGLGEGVAP